MAIVAFVLQVEKHFLALTTYHCGLGQKESGCADSSSTLLSKKSISYYVVKDFKFVISMVKPIEMNGI